ncbi:kin of IRRE-like protein 1 isoform X1 [Lates japonicus]|uniref:Kin of IRRE-like protein 1 isoform X1 n=1 Tax=Lates japonicus TaxID=270547 RepID=A0AAD3RL89_LATJO|nr:kin of IRRE-like protein 1 isoform X1 [Lates japonicus]
MRPSEGAGGLREKCEGMGEECRQRGSLRPSRPVGGAGPEGDLSCVVFNFFRALFSGPKDGLALGIGEDLQGTVSCVCRNWGNNLEILSADLTVTPCHECQAPMQLRWAKGGVVLQGAKRKRNVHHKAGLMSQYLSLVSAPWEETNVQHPGSLRSNPVEAGAAAKKQLMSL